ncbi:glycosyl hydrolase family 92-domain-containing protein [Chytriomyces cf. hyalinus JEL632]|nr:glycosyl hydrolase family 92-domain-containing protein [Chytriomyces cf. hyalinus JEL632]
MTVLSKPGITRRYLPRFKTRPLIIVAVIALCLIVQRQCHIISIKFKRSEVDNLKWVDPRIGTDGDGHVWLGASVPNGMVKVSADSDHVEPGYHPTRPIIGFSHTHVSGTGGGRSYQNMVLTPHWNTGNTTLLEPFATRIPDFVSHRDWEESKPGYYAVSLSSVKLNASITAAASFAKHQWSFHLDTVRKNNLLAAGENVTLHAVLKAKHPTMGFKSGVAESDGSRIMVTGEYQDTWSSSFELHPTNGIYKVYSCMGAASTKPHQYGVLTNTESQNGGRSQDTKTVQVKTTNSVGLYDYSGDGDNIGGYFSFTVDETMADENGNVQVLLDVGISFKSMDKACERLKEAQAVTFDEQVKIAATLWKQNLGAISVQEPLLRKEDEIIFFSSFYRMFFMPVNRTGENPAWPDGTETLPYYDDFYCIWDTFRTMNPLLTLIAPKLETDLINSLMLSAKYNRGYLGDSHVGNSFGITQGGNNAEILITEAFIKKIPGINYTAAYELLQTSSETESPFHYIFEGRGHVDEYKTDGYVSVKSKGDLDDLMARNNGRFKSSSVSRTVEYAYADYTIGMMAKSMGFLNDSVALLRRSGNWKMLWDNETVDHGYTGFLQPRLKAVDGRPGPFKRISPTFGSPINHFNDIDEFYEDCSWSYSFFAPHQMKTVIQYMGGDETFISRIDAFFKLGIYNPGNEPAFLVPVLYHYAGRPDLSTKRLDTIIKNNFTSQPNGIPGNDDSASMGSWFMCAAMGIFPVAGQDVYLIVAPRFRAVTVRVGEEGRNLFKIRVVVRDGEEEDARVIQSAKLNGRILNRSWLKHEEIVRGGKLELFMGSSLREWGYAVENRPPSFDGLD